MTGHVIISEVEVSYVCRNKQDRITRALQGISWCHWMYNVIDEVSQEPRSL